MAERIKITPRAKKIALENKIDVTKLSINGTGFDGGICEKDILGILKYSIAKATPLAKKIAEFNGIALDEINGTGLGGKIKKADVMAIVGGMTSESAAGEMATTSVSGDGFMANGKEVARVVPYSGIRKIIGDRMSQSKFTAPHLYFTQKVNLEELLDLRKAVNSAQERKTSVTDYIALAVVKTLQKYPEMNASLEEDKIYEYKTVNLGIAVAAPAGLIVPVVKDAEKKKLLEIAEDAKRLFEKARNGTLSPSEYSGGTFTISNLGMFGIENFTAIINPPEVGILAISATKDEPFVEKDEWGEKKIGIKPMMNITLTVDHRVVDGLLAAQFVTEIKRLLECPIELML